MLLYYECFLKIICFFVYVSKSCELYYSELLNCYCDILWAELTKFYL